MALGSCKKDAPDRLRFPSRDEGFVHTHRHPHAHANGYEASCQPPKNICRGTQARDMCGRPGQAVGGKATDRHHPPTRTCTESGLHMDVSARDIWLCTLRRGISVAIGTMRITHTHTHTRTHTHTHARTPNSYISLTHADSENRPFPSGSRRRRVRWGCQSQGREVQGHRQPVISVIHTHTHTYIRVCI